ncbi:MAG: NAD(P)H-binding protein [Chloroflexia bacterium]|nr:NAD(P)H-binding protein [Chloroflexia bacterium]
MNFTDSDDLAEAQPVTGKILITGGAGFVGTNLIAALGTRPIRVLVRDSRRAAKIARSNVEIVEGDVTQPETLRGAMDGIEAVIHLVAVISEEGRATFDTVIRQGTVNVVSEAKRAGVARFLQMSALGARNDPRFGYFEAKWQAEKAVEQSGLAWTIFRPSVIFGPGDEFINTLARLVKTAPIVPVVGNGRSRFQPVAVGEVAIAFVHALDHPECAGHIYELGGGNSYSYEAMLDVIAHQLGKPKPKVHIPVNLMKLVVKLSKPLPKALRPPVTDEQLRMLAIDNATESSATAELIGRKPLSLEDGIDYITAGKASKR